MKALVIYGLTGEIFGIHYGRENPPADNLHIWIDIPEGAYLTEIDVSDPNNHKPIITKNESIDIQQLEEELNEVKKSLNPTLDPETCTVDEAISFKLAEFAKACTASIEYGQQVETSVGTYHFSYGIYDQLNLHAAYSHATATGMNVPYHADKVDCAMWPAKDIVKIYGKNLYSATYHTTYCNLLNNIFRICTEVPEVLALNYGMPLPEKQNKILFSIMVETQKLFDAELKNFESKYGKI